MKVALIGGTGFVGSYIAQALQQQGDEPVLISRRPVAGGKAGQTGPLVRHYAAGQAGSLRQALADCQAVMFLPGILHGSPEQFDAVHVQLPQQVMQLCGELGIRRYLHMSALGAQVDGPSHYLRSKGRAEQAVMASDLDWSVFRPSVVFGAGDSFLSLFASLTRYVPVMPLASAQARFQPVWVEDVAAAFAGALRHEQCIGQSYDLVGPEVYSLQQIVQLCARLQNRRVLLLPLPERLARLQALCMEQLPSPLMSRDNLDSMRVDNVSVRDYPEIFGRQPASMEQVAPTYIGARSA